MKKINVHSHGAMAIVDIHLDDGGWHGHYRFNTHGMTEFEIVEKANAITLHHQKKAARLTGFRAMKRDLPNGYTISDASIVERGTDIELMLRVFTPDGVWIRLDAVYPDVDSIPDDNEIARIAREAALNDAQTKVAVNQHIESIRKALGA